MMKVADIMSTRVVSVSMDDRLSVVYDIFRQVNFHHLVVLADKRLIGVLSDRDLFKAISPRVGTKAATALDDTSLNKRVHQIMTREPITLNVNAGLMDAVKLFNRNKISCLPVVDDKHHCVGMLSWRDIFHYIEQKKSSSQK